MGEISIGNRNNYEKKEGCRYPNTIRASTVLLRESSVMRCKTSSTKNPVVDVFSDKYLTLYGH